MKLFVIGVIVFFSTGFTQASANKADSAETRLEVALKDGERVESSSLLIVGRGTQLSKTGESLALACVEISESKCSKISWIYFSQNHEAYALGLPIDLIQPEAISSPEVRALVKARMREYKITARNDRLWNNVTGKTNPTGILVGSYVLALVLAGTNPVGILVVTGATLSASAVMLIRNGEFGSFMLSAGSGNNQTFYDQNGWNGASQPKILSPSKFDRLFKIISGPIVTEKISRY